VDDTDTVTGAKHALVGIAVQDVHRDTDNDTREHAEDNGAADDVYSEHHALGGDADNEVACVEKDGIGCLAVEDICDALRRCRQAWSDVGDEMDRHS